MERDLLHFWALLSRSTIAVFVDNSTAMAYVRKAGGTRLPTLNSIAQQILQWAEDLHFVLAPQFIMGRHNVRADALSRPNQIQGSESALKMEAFLDLHRRWPVMVDLFATSSNHRCSLYFSPFHNQRAFGDGCAPPVLGRSSGVCLPSVGADSSCAQEAPFVIRGVDDSDSSLLASAAMVPGISGAHGKQSGCSSIVFQSTKIASFPPSSSGDPQAVSSYLATIQCFARAEGFSARVVAQIGFAHRSSSRTKYQVKWSVYRKWCRVEGHSISHPSFALRHVTKRSIDGLPQTRSSDLAT